MSTWMLTCQCGWETTGTEAEVVADAQQHGRDIHNMEVTHDEAMAMASEIES